MKTTKELVTIIEKIDESILDEYLAADTDEVLRINKLTGEVEVHCWQIGENKDNYIGFECGEREYRYDSLDDIKEALLNDMEHTYEVSD